MLVLGLTGGIASGKSTVSTVLRQEGLTVVDLDEIAHRCTEKGAWGYKRVVRAFGRDILTQEGKIDRTKLADLVFNDKDLRSKLNRATHLPIAVSLAWNLFRCFVTLKAVVVLDAPLLFETKLDRIVTTDTVCVWCRPDQQVQRLMLRDECSLSHANARIASQMPLDQKRDLADLVIDSSGTKASTLNRAKEVANVYLKKRLIGWKS